MKYTAIFDAGKPYDVGYDSDESLQKGLKDFFLQHRQGDYQFDVKVYNSLDEDISESQFISEMVADILNGL